MDETCVLAETGTDPSIVLWVLAALVVAVGVAAMIAQRRNSRGATLVVLLLGFVSVIGVGGTALAEPASAAACEAPITQPVAPPVVVPPTTPLIDSEVAPTCVPSLSLAAPEGPAEWATASRTDDVYSFTVAPDPVWVDTLPAVEGSFTVQNSWILSGYITAYDIDGNVVADTSSDPWTLTTSGSGVTFSVDTAPVIAEHIAEVQSAHPEVVSTYPVALGIAGEAIVTATYSDGCSDQQSLSFPVTYHHSGGGGNN